MALWISSFLCLFYVLIEGRTYLQGLSQGPGFITHRKDLTAVITHLKDLHETLLAGLSPCHTRWESLASLPSPWNQVASDSLLMLRKSGGALIPTLNRLCILAEDQNQALLEARTKTAQAISQALICAGFVPLLGLGLASLMPALQNHTPQWIAACLGALCTTGIGCKWMLHMAEAARWGNLPPARRSWILITQCTGEKLLAQIRCGTPPDLAWTRATEYLLEHCPELLTLWGHSIWNACDPMRSKQPGTLQQTLIAVGHAIKQSIQISIMEGRPCTERIETTLLGCKQETQAYMNREMALLSTRTLKPLFLCVAPSLIGLLVYSMILTLSESPELGSFFEH